MYFFYFLYFLKFVFRLSNFYLTKVNTIFKLKFRNIIIIFLIYKDREVFTCLCYAPLEMSAWNQMLNSIDFQRFKHIDILPTIHKTK